MTTLAIEDSYFSFESESISEKIERLEKHRDKLLKKYGHGAAGEQEQCILLEFHKDIVRLKLLLKPKKKKEAKTAKADKKKWGFLDYSYA